MNAERLRVEDVGPSYQRRPLTRRHRPPRPIGRDSYSSYRACLRLDFEFRCAYCLAHENEVAPTTSYGGFEIEHFKPKGIRRFRRFANVYRNCLWACHECNRAKSSKWPTSKERAIGARFVDPTEEPLGSYLRVDGVAVRVAEGAPSAAAAEYMIEEIRLNSAAHRLRRERRHHLAERIAMLEGMLLVLQERVSDEDGSAEILQDIEETKAALVEVQAMTGTSFPWDGPMTCRCES